MLYDLPATLPRSYAANSAAQPSVSIENKSVAQKSGFKDATIEDTMVPPVVQNTSKW